LRGARRAASEADGSADCEGCLVCDGQGRLAGVAYADGRKQRAAATQGRVDGLLDGYGALHGPPQPSA